MESNKENREAHLAAMLERLQEKVHGRLWGGIGVEVWTEAESGGGCVGYCVGGGEKEKHFSRPAKRYSDGCSYRQG